jgi:hypothetical protein
MLETIKRTLVLGAMLGMTFLAQGFSLLGPLPTDPNAAPTGLAAWQVVALGYDQPGDIGGPMNLGEEYRWNSPTITYAFDQSFLIYFGQRGVDAIEEAIQIFNDLPRVSDMSAELTEFPTETTKVNFTAQALGVRDLKSTALTLMLEVMGLAEPERWTWTLRGRNVAGNPPVTNYSVIIRNFDPVTFAPTNRVNDAFYSYEIVDPIPPPNYAEAFEIPLFTPQFDFSSVAGAFGLGPGELFTGLTRDDAGGWRYLFRFQNYNVETLPPTTSLVPGFVPGQPGPGQPGTPGTPGTPGVPRVGPWSPYIGTSNTFTNVVGNIFAPWTPITGLVIPGTQPPFTIPPGITNIGTTNLTNLVINAGLRPGLEKIEFVRVNFDSLLGQAFFPKTNFYTDQVISNYTIVPQFVQRVIPFPDLLFSAADLGTVFGIPVQVARGTTFVNNDTINGNTEAAGPGTITRPIDISFSNILPYYFNSSSDFFLSGDPLTGPNPFNRSFVWGSFDASSDEVIVYPDLLSIQDLEAQVLGQ